jgi:hypothetical protein
MSGIIKIIMLQLFWFIAVKCNYELQFALNGIALVLSYLNFYFYKPNIHFKSYNFCLLFFILFGLFHEFILSHLGLIDYGQSGFPWWLSSLYIVFICYYGDIFKKFLGLKWPILFILGGVGGVLSYYSGGRIAGLNILSNYYYLGVFILWGFFFPLSIKYFKN